MALGLIYSRRDSLLSAFRVAPSVQITANLTEPARQMMNMQWQTSRISVSCTKIFTNSFFSQYSIQYLLIMMGSLSITCIVAMNCFSCMCSTNMPGNKSSHSIYKMSFSLMMTRGRLKFLSMIMSSFCSEVTAKAWRSRLPTICSSDFMASKCQS